MPTSDVGAVAGAVTSVTDLVSNILNRADRDGPQEKLDENAKRIMEAFVNNSFDSDEFRVFIGELCRDAGHSLTPTTDVQFGRREFLHAALSIAAEHIYAKQILSRLVAGRVKE